MYLCFYSFYSVGCQMKGLLCLLVALVPLVTFYLRYVSCYIFYIFMSSYILILYNIMFKCIYESLLYLTF